MKNAPLPMRTEVVWKRFFFRNVKKILQLLKKTLICSRNYHTIISFKFVTDNRLTINKELPTTKWRRDRRIRLSSEYHHSNHEPVGTVKPLGESNQSNSISDSSMEIPLDMSVGGTKPPPPPYRDPLPGSTFCAMSRPSVITQAPKREVISNQENKESPKRAMAMCDEISPATGKCQHRQPFHLMLFNI